MTGSTTTGETETASDTIDSASDTNSGTSSSGADGSSGGTSGSEGTSTGEGTSSSTGEESSSSTGEGSSSTGEMGTGLYGSCAGELTCAAPFECQEVDVGEFTGLNWCTQPCDGPGECPAADGGTAFPVCLPGAQPGDPGLCALACDEETSCPDEMECHAPMGSTDGVCAFAPAD